jgi:porin
MRLGVAASALLVVLAAMAPAEADDDIFSRDSLTGPWGGARDSLAQAGVVLGADEILDMMGNPMGGMKQGMAFEGRFEVFANVDLNQAFGWNGAIFHANAYQIQGRGLSADDVGNILTIGNIGATPSSRLFAAWFQQSLFDDTLSIRVGQIAADDEFYVSQYASLFIDSAFGWPSILGADLPSGGPAYPLATPGVRVKQALSPEVTVMAGIFNGNPAPAGAGDPQRRDASGTSFRTDGGVFGIGELSYAATLPLLGDDVPGTYKVGAWYHDGLVADLRFDSLGHSLADPVAVGPAMHRGDYGFYLIADQMLLRGGSGNQGLGLFTRLGSTPADRNMIAFHADTGLTYSGFWPERENDQIGLGLSYDGVSAARRSLARDAQGLLDFTAPLPDFESAVELTYQTQIAPWWVVQPDIQVILHPGARLFGIKDPAPSVTGDALVLGLRTAINF